MISESSRYSLLLGALSCMSFAVCMWFAFHAGTVGDVKAASCGDPAAALALEDTAAPFFIVGILLMLAVAASLTRFTIGRRIALGAFFLLIGGPFLWITAVWVEGWGLRWCN